MNPRILIVFVLLLFTRSLSLETDPKPTSNITVMGTVFCDACSDNNFSKHSYFLQGVKVQVECKFIVNSTSKEEISIMVDRSTDKYGAYRLDIPPVDGFECGEGREMESVCRATLMGSPSSLCNVPGLSSSTGHVTIKSKDANLCLYNLNALYYWPAKKDGTLCGTGTNTRQQHSSSLNSSLFFWPPFFPPFPFPFPSPSLPFPFPPIPFLTPPPSFPFPFPSPPSLPFPFPPIPFLTPPPSFPFPPWFSPPSPPSFSFPPIPFLSPPPSPPPSFPFPPIPFLFPPPPSPPPPSFPFPLPPFPPFTPIPSLLPPPPSPPPSPPPPSFPWPFPPFPFPPFTPVPKPGQPPPPPPPTFSLGDPTTWFPPSPPNKP